MMNHCADNSSEIREDIFNWKNQTNVKKFARIAKNIHVIIV